MSLPFYMGQVPTADDFNALAVKAELAAPGGAATIGYGSTTVAGALATVTAPPVSSVAGRTGAITLTAADVNGVAQLNGDGAQNFFVANATGSAHAVPLGQADLRYAPFWFWWWWWCIQRRSPIATRLHCVWVPGDYGGGFGGITGHAASQVFPGGPNRSWGYPSLPTNGFG